MRKEILSWSDDGQGRWAGFDVDGNFQGKSVDDLRFATRSTRCACSAGTYSAADRYGPMGRSIETVFNGTTTRFVHPGEMELAELV